MLWQSFHIYGSKKLLFHQSITHWILLSLTVSRNPLLKKIYLRAWNGLTREDETAPPAGFLPQIRHVMNESDPTPPVGPV